jgi:hypothetical protein
MAKTLFKSPDRWIGTDAAAFAGEVLIDGKRIAAVSRIPSSLSVTDVQTIDATGLTLVPGRTCYS